MTAPSDETFKGDILVYVDGYKVEDWRCMPHNNPEDTFPFPEASGWAVGDNPRDRYCSRLAADKIRRFKNYDEVVRYVFEKGRKWKSQRFQLMYQVNHALSDVPTFHEVSTLDEILAIDKLGEDERRAFEARRKELQAEYDKEYPGIKVLQGVVGRHTAFAASALLGAIQRDGLDMVKSAHSQSSFYRLVKILRQVGLLEKQM